MADGLIPTVRLEEIPPDTPLLADVFDPAGHLLLPAGTPLSETFKARLVDRGLNELPRETIFLPEMESEAARIAREAQIQERIDTLFRCAGEGASTRALHAAVLAYRLATSAPGSRRHA